MSDTPTATTEEAAPAMPIVQPSQAVLTAAAEMSQHTDARVVAIQPPPDPPVDPEPDPPADPTPEPDPPADPQPEPDPPA